MQEGSVVRSVALPLLRQARHPPPKRVDVAVLLLKGLDAKALPACLLPKAR